MVGEDEEVVVANTGVSTEQTQDRSAVSCDSVVPDRHGRVLQRRASLVVHVVRAHRVGVAHAIENGLIRVGGLAGAGLTNQLEGTVIDLAVNVVTGHACGREYVARAHGLRIDDGEDLIVSGLGPLNGHASTEVIRRVNCLQEFNSLRGDVVDRTNGLHGSTEV